MQLQWQSGKIQCSGITSPTLFSLVDNSLILENSAVIDDGSAMRFSIAVQSSQGGPQIENDYCGSKFLNPWPLWELITLSRVEDFRRNPRCNHVKTVSLMQNDVHALHWRLSMELQGNGTFRLRSGQTRGEVRAGIGVIGVRRIST
jgi:hypothetical protein